MFFFRSIVSSETRDGLILINFRWVNQAEANDFRTRAGKRGKSH